MSVEDSIIATATELKKAREHVRQLEEKLRELVNYSVNQPISGFNRLVSLSDLLKPQPTNDPMPERIMALMSANSPEWSYAFKDIFQNINASAENEPYIRSLLSRMVKEGRIESRGWGKYGVITEKKEKPKAG